MNLFGIILAPTLLMSAGAMDRPGALASAPGLETWSPIPGPARTDHSAIYDPVRGRLIVFGGEGFQDDVWALSLGDAHPKWIELMTSGVRPPGRNGHSAIYDPLLDRMIVFGGVVKHFVAPGEYFPEPSNDVWALSLSSLTWTELPVAGVSPPPRIWHTAIYDALRHRMVVHGGAGPGYAELGDLWALDLSPSPSWSQVSSDTSPPPRRFHSAIYDALRDRMVVFGGSNAAGNRNDIWSFSLSTSKWTELATTGSLPPPVGPGREAVHDAAHDQMIVDGGVDGGVWTLSLASLVWTRTLSLDAPPYRDSQSATFDPVHRRMVVFGGETDLIPDEEILPIGDAWTFSVDDRSWSPLASVDVEPLTRSGQTAVYDPSRKRMLMFGGMHRSDQGHDVYMQDVWQLSLDGRMAWARLGTAGDIPPGRAGQTAIYDPEGDRMIVFGGAEPVDCPFHPDGDCAGAVNDAWALNLGGSIPTWQKLAPLGDPPSPRAGHTAVYDPVRRRMLVFGGGDSTVWALDLSGALRWSELSPSGTAPSTRSGHAAIYDPTGDRMVVFGGTALTGRGPYNDTWALDLAGAGTWRLLIPGSSTSPDLPTVRWKHAAVYDATRRRMLIDGGFGPASQQDPSNGRSNTWALSLGSAPAWSRVAPTASSPPPRSDHSAIFDPVGQRVVIYGSSMWKPDTWTLTLEDISTPVLLSLVRPKPGGAFALDGLRPDPAVGDLMASFTLPSAAAARLELLDVAGRVRIARDVGTLGAGRHVVRLGGEGAVPSGIYWLRLTQGRRVLTARATVLN